MTKRILQAVFGAAALAALLASPALAGSAAPSRTIKFKASYAGRAIVRAGSSTAAITAHGTGRGVVVGKSKLDGKGTGQQGTPCPTWFGTGTITAADRGKIKFKVLQRAISCPGAANPSLNTVSGRAAFKGGTGKYKKARGRFSFKGTYDRGTGKFSVKFTGKLTY